MPHRPPEGQGTGIDSSAIYTPPRVAGSAAAAIMRQSNSQGALHNNTPSSINLYDARSSGVVTPVVKSKAWIGSSSVAISNEGLRHGNVAMMPRIDTRNKSSDSTDRSTGTTDDSRSIATLATEDEREVTASALLMVANAAEREQYLSSAVSSSTSPGSSSSSAVPLKKRKKQMDILRRQEGKDIVSEHSDKNNNNITSTTGNNKSDSNEQNPCHISPVSHSSTEHGMVGNRTESNEDGTPVRRTNAASTSNSSHSYDSKDLNQSYRNSGVVSKGETTQELLDSSKVHSTAQIGAQTSSMFPSQVVIPHFPTVLHHVLDNKDLNGNIIQWIPDGESWKVVRWDAMRREVLPKYFADLRDENGSSCGTIDAFLYHLDAWGFKEIQSGRNAGSYRHDLFIRGAQKLCVKMRFTSAFDLTNGHKLPKTVSPGRSRGGETERSMLQVPMLQVPMLQVPMLASVESDPNSQAQPPNKRPRYDTHAPMHWPYSNNRPPVMWGGQYPHHDTAHLHAYGMRVAAAAAMNNPYSANESYTIDPRTQIGMSRHTPSQQQYNPPQVRSGRGALRLATSAKNRASAVSTPFMTPVFRSGFPVSNRGKGPRKPTACRTTLIPTSVTAVTSTSDFQQETKLTSNEPPKQYTASVALDEAQQIGSAVNGVAVAISRKTKRKLPLSTNNSVVDVFSQKTPSNISKEDNAVDDKETVEDNSQ